MRKINLCALGGISNPRPPAFAASVFPLDYKGLTIENEHTVEANK